MVLWAHKIQPPNGISINLADFAHYIRIVFMFHMSKPFSDILYCQTDWFQSDPIMLKC